MGLTKFPDTRLLNLHTHRTLPAASIHTTARAARKKRCPNWRSWATAPEPPNLKHRLRHATTGQHGRGAQINSTYNEKGTAKDPAFDAMSLISISRRCLVFLGRSTLWFDVHGRVAWLIESSLFLGATTRAQAPVDRCLVSPLHRGLALGSWWTGASVTADDPNRRLAGNRRNEGQRSRRCTRLL